ncbi:hypothetical protein KIPB_005462, partial [Kipferlia bialata]|eukprot:g5462.t1
MQSCPGLFWTKKRFEGMTGQPNQMEQSLEAEAVEGLYPEGFERTEDGYRFTVS